MWTTIAMWGGVAGLFISIFAVIILFLTRKNILDILDKDVILFDGNFELKKSAIEDAFKLVDEIQEKGEQITLNNEFKMRAKKCYNELLCVISDVRIADEFYNIAIDNNEQVSDTRIANFKISCRKDIGLNVKKANAVNRIIKQNETGTGANETVLRAKSINGTNNGNTNNNLNSNITNQNNPYQPGYTAQPTQNVRPAQTNTTANIQPNSNTQTTNPSQSIPQTQTSTNKPNQTIKPNTSSASQTTTTKINKK